MNPISVHLQLSTVLMCARLGVKYVMVYVPVPIIHCYACRGVIPTCVGTCTCMCVCLHGIVLCVASYLIFRFYKFQFAHGHYW